MGIRPPKFGDFIKNTDGKDPQQTAMMQSMTIAKWAEYRTGEINISQCNLIPVKEDQVLGPILAWEMVPADPHQFIGVATVLVDKHLPPICVIITHNVCPLHESIPEEDCERFRELYAQRLLEADRANPGCLNKWDEQALMMFAGLKEDEEQRALLVQARGLRPDDEDEDAPAAENMAELAQEPASWLKSFAPMVTTLYRSTMTKIAALADITTSATITDVPPMFVPETTIKAKTPEWGASTEVPFMTPPPGPPPAQSSGAVAKATTSASTAKEARQRQRGGTYRLGVDRGSKTLQDQATTTKSPP